MKITGANAFVFLSSFDPSLVLHGDGAITTAAKTKYFVLNKAAGSSIPVAPRAIFQSPHEGHAQITLLEGDEIFPIDEEKFCKSSADISFEQGTVEVTDDCNEGFNSSILDGYTTVSGSLAGFFRYDDVTRKFTDATKEILNRFVDIIEDDGAGGYVLHPKDNSQMFLLVKMSGNVRDPQNDTWFMAPILISSSSTSLGLKDAQNMDLSWTMGDGRPVIYETPAAA
jgi:hypothetical protein